jgi:uncharacterized protein
MFVGVARVTLEIPGASSLKAKRQVLRRVTDRVKAKFNAAVAEVEDNEVWNLAVVAFAVVGNERRHVGDMLDKVLQYIEDLYVAPVLRQEKEVLAFGEQVFAGGEDEASDFRHLTIPRGERTLAEAEGLGDWEDRHLHAPPPPSPARASTSEAPRKSGAPTVNLDRARAMARSLRNRRSWESGEARGAAAATKDREDEG